MNETPKISPKSDQENEEAGAKPANDAATVPARRRFIATDTLVLAALALCAGIACWHYLGRSAVEQAIRSDLRLIVQIVPMIVAGLMLAGLVEILVPKELVGPLARNEFRPQGFASGDRCRRDDTWRSILVVSDRTCPAASRR